MSNLLLEEMTWPEVRDALASGTDTVVIPVASIEQHGHHLAELTDVLLGVNAACELARRLEHALVAPAIRPGLSEHHMAMPGTLTLRPETFRMLVEDYVACYTQHGFRTIILMASHGGNIATLDRMADTLDAQYPSVRVIAAPEVPTNAELNTLTAELGLPEGVNGGHADDRETSEMLHLAPQHVRMDSARPGFTGRVTPEKRQEFFEKGVLAFSDVGPVGDPRGATATRGEWYIAHTAERLARDVMAKLERGNG
ncbi:MAG: creatininase family protein [Lentisphaerae bacterium]|jgi:creatinine amidohydrolase|nr:creatininase family protein [Lentisphaerota bacterium]MBT4818421.1 creatininase family protein [Lentisphaerota bacterium]MBT5608357.1 creatininase family protein [Lentisphaerota bacterium]MBT7060974.1 creatininase family protein [Lentisphaerota bacterium]MBT7848341.1 creatininase family protein [Lentisphaerota bacterium]